MGIRFPMNVKFLGENAKVPTRGHDDDAGLDIYITEDVWINPGEAIDVKTDLAIQIPQDLWVMLVGRSSTLRKRGLLVNTGIIDEGYRGELFVNVLNTSPRAVQLLIGERIAQMIVLPNISRFIDFTVVDRLDDHARGAAGFGSTGR